MCSPAIALVAVTVASTAASMYSQNQQSKYASAVADQNADIAEAQSEDAINRGNAEAEQRRREMRLRQGTQTANMGATGAELGSGSSLDIFGDTAQFGTLDALTTVNNAQREAYGYQVQGMNAVASGNAAQQQASSAMSQTLMTAPLKAYGAYQMGGGTWSPFTQSKAAPISAATGTATGR